MPQTITAQDMARARNVAHRMAYLNGKDAQDMESVAMEALTLARRSFDGTGTFAGYALQRVRYALLDELRREHPEPVDVATLADATHVVLVATVDLDTLMDHKALHEALEVLHVEFLLDGVDRRRFAHRSGLNALRRLLG